MKYGTTKWGFLAVAKQQTNDIAAAPSPTSFKALMESLAVGPGKSRMPNGTS